MAEIKTFIICILVVSLCMLSLYTYVGGINTKFGPYLTSNFSSSNVSNMSRSLDKMTNLSTAISQTYNKTGSSLSDPTAATDISKTGLAGGAFAALPVIWGVVDISISFVQDLIIMTGLPVGFLGTFLMGIIGVIFMFGILYALLKWEF